MVISQNDVNYRIIDPGLDTDLLITSSVQGLRSIHMAIVISKMNSIRVLLSMGQSSDSQSHEPMLKPESVWRGATTNDTTDLYTLEKGSLTT